MIMFALEYEEKKSIKKKKKWLKKINIIFEKIIRDLQYNWKKFKKKKWISIGVTLSLWSIHGIYRTRSTEMRFYKFYTIVAFSDMWSYFFRYLHK